MLESVFHPRLDASNHARALIVPDRRRPERADYERALQLLDSAPETASDDLFVIEARLHVSCQAALHLRDPLWADRALTAASAIVSQDRTPPRRGYPDRFLAIAQASVKTCTSRLGEATWVGSDAMLNRKLQALEPIR